LQKRKRRRGWSQEKVTGEQHSGTRGHRGGPEKYGRERALNHGTGKKRETKKRIGHPKKKVEGKPKRREVDGGGGEKDGL